MWTRHHGIDPPLKGGPKFRKGGFYMYFVQFSILGKFRRVFILFKNPEQNAGGFLFCPKFSAASRPGFYSVAFFIRKSPLKTPFSQNFLARFARGFLFCPKIFPALRAGSYFVYFFLPDFAWALILFNFHFPKTRPGFY